MNFQPKNRPRSIYTDQSVYIEQKKADGRMGGYEPSAEAPRKEIKRFILNNNVNQVPKSIPFPPGLKYHLFWGDFQDRIFGKVHI